MTTHELETGQTVMVAVVPRTAYDFDIGRVNGRSLVYKDSDYNRGLSNRKTLQLRDMSRDVLNVEYELIGTIQHPGVCSFDPKLIVQKTETFGLPALWTCYTNPSNAFCDSPQASAISRLASCGYYWDNPMGDKAPLYPHEPTFTAGWEEEEFEMALRGYKRDRRECDAWHEAESRKLSVEQMVVVILIKKV